MADSHEKLHRLPDGIYAFSEAPFNMATEARMAIRYALRCGFLTGTEEEWAGKMTFRVSGSRFECLLVDDRGERSGPMGPSLWVSTEHDQSTDVFRSRLLIISDLATGPGQPLSLMAVLDMEPVYTGGDEAQSQFELEPDAINLHFSFGEMSFDFNLAKNGLVILRNRGVRTVQAEVLFNGVGFEKGGLPKLAHYFDPEMVGVPPATWLSLLRKVLAGEVREKNARKAQQKIREILVGEAALVRRILSSAPKRG